MASGAITTSKIAVGNITTTLIADGNVTTAKLPDNAITTAKIADSNITGAKILADAIDSEKIADAGVPNRKLVHDSITINGRSVALGGSITVSGGGTPVPSCGSVSAKYAVLTGTLSSLMVAVRRLLQLSSRLTQGTRSIQVRHLWLLQTPQTNTVTVTKTSDARFSFPVSQEHLGTYHATLDGTVTRTLDDSEYTHRVTGSVVVARGWYVDVDTSQPSALSQMTNHWYLARVWFSSRDNKQYRTATSTSVLPTRTGGYDFKSGELFLNATSRGVIEH